MVDRAERDRLVLENLPLAKWHAARFSWRRRSSPSEADRDATGGVSRLEFDDLYSVAVLAMFEAADCYLDGRTKHESFSVVASQRIRGRLLCERNRSIGHMDVSDRMAKARAVVEKAKARNAKVTDAEIEDIILKSAETDRSRAKCLSRAIRSRWMGLDDVTAVSSGSPEKEVDDADELESAMMAIPEDAMPLVRRYFGVGCPEENYREIAQSLDCTGSGARWRVVRGIEKARRTLMDGDRARAIQ